MTTQNLVATLESIVQSAELFTLTEKHPTNMTGRAGTFEYDMICRLRIMVQPHFGAFLV